MAALPATPPAIIEFAKVPPQVENFIPIETGKRFEIPSISVPELQAAATAPTPKKTAQPKPAASVKKPPAATVSPAATRYSNPAYLSTIDGWTFLKFANGDTMAYRHGFEISGKLKGTLGVGEIGSREVRLMEAARRFVISGNLANTVDIGLQLRDLAGGRERAGAEFVTLGVRVRYDGYTFSIIQREAADPILGADIPLPLLEGLILSFKSTDRTGGHYQWGASFPVDIAGGKKSRSPTLGRVAVGFAVDDNNAKTYNIATWLNPKTMIALQNFVNARQNPGLRVEVFRRVMTH
ncbi:Uncharacterised protein [Candidatus Gugararchaeum adminiculabundum]|nr:Uncharacterised protein [Candidatus Gugararchaeum adminiculabundum]